MSRVASRDVLVELRCRFGCEAPVAIVHVPEGCICWSDPVQALCQQHLITAQSTGEIRLIVDFREAGE